MASSTPPARMPEEGPRARLRTETPPAHYWRRWTSDDTGVEPAITAPPVADADAGLSIAASTMDSVTAEPAHAPALPGAATSPAATAAMPVAPAPAGMASLAEDPGPAIDKQVPFRVLIVEDDRAQALFAQSVLHGAGMVAEVEMDGGQVLPSIARFKPDLLLMDLHMPGRDGKALTIEIRQRPEYLDLPIVFLTGDPDPERQYEVLESGADDFLTKPIRPRHLIAAVSNRIARMRRRMAAQPGSPLEGAAQDLNPDTGLYTRAYLLQQLGSALDEHAAGGLFFLEIASALGLRERYGYAAYEQLLLQAARQLALIARPHALARLNDNSFLLLARGMPEAELGTFAVHLHEHLLRERLAVREGESVNLRAVVGYALLPGSFSSREDAIEAVEHAAIGARGLGTPIAAFVPSPSETENARNAIASATLELLYQPIVSVAGGDTAQYQVLMRLRQPDGALLPAAQVLPVAEASGDIVVLDHQVMERALDLLQQKAGSPTPLRLFVSQSPRTLARTSAAQWLMDAIARHGVPASQLVVDVRLADALIHSAALQEFAQAPMQAGVQFCLSQFEPGPEAEALLTLLPLSYLRVSSRYASAHQDANLRSELRGVIDLAHRHNLQVIGQQIEDPQAAAAMWMGGVDYIQGNLVQGVGEDLGFDFHNAVL